MELSSQEGEIPIPINSTFSGGGGGGGGGHGHMIHHDHHFHHHAPHNNIIPAVPASSSAQISPINGPAITISTNLLEDQQHNGSNKKIVRYKECLKNHAAAMGGNATDGCGEFMPSGEEGTIEALNCSACNCHRNFHRKEIEGEQQQQQQQAITPFDYYHHMSPHHFNRVGRKVILGHHKNILAATPEALGYPTPTGTLISSRAGGGGPTAHPMIMPYNMGSIPSESDEDGGGGGGGVVMAARPTAQLVKKRFRTKFTPEQKEKMLNFAEKVGWKIQKQEESVVQQLCQEIGVKRRVLKVWMHNNKHNLAKKNNININPPPPPPPTTTATSA